MIVLLNNHISTAMWCCSPHDGEGLWYTNEYPEEMWIQGLELVTQRYLGNPWVAGMDLRNEIRPEHDLGATWGTGIPETELNSNLIWLYWQHKSNIGAILVSLI